MAKTENILNKLLATNQKIEKLLEKAPKKSAKRAGNVETAVGGMGGSFQNVVKSLDKIETESKKTNELLQELIDTTNIQTKESVAEVAEGANAMTKLGKGIPKLVKAIEVLAKVPEGTADKFRKIVMSVALIDPKTGESYLDDKQVENSQKVYNSLMLLGKGIALIGATMIAMSFALPMIAKGTVGFIIVLTNITIALWMVDKVVGAGAGGLKDTSALKSLMILAKGIAIFGAMMVLFSFVLPQIAKGAMGFIIVLSGLTLALWAVDMVIGHGAGGLKDTSPVGSLMKLGMGIALFGLTMIMFSYALPQIAWGAVGFITVLAALSVSLWAVDKMVSGGKKSPLDSLYKLGLGIAFFSVAMILVGYMAMPFAKGALVVTLTLFALSFVMPMLGNKSVEKGSKNLIGISIALGIFTISMALWANLVAPKLEWGDIAKLAAIIVGMSLIGVVLGIPAIAPYAVIGAGVLITLGAALALFSIGLAIYAKNVAGKLETEDLIMLAGVMGVMALVGTVVGLVAPLVILGAGALLIAGTALIAISTGLLIFKKTKFTENDADNLSSAIKAITTTFILWPWEVIGITTGAIALTAAGLSLLPLSLGLWAFRKTKWNKKDSSNLKEATQGVAQAFGTALDDVNWISLFAGIGMMALAGGALTSLAFGIQEFADLSFTEYEYSEKEGKLVPVRKIKLTDQMLVQTGKNIGNVIGAITMPLSKFGEQMMGGGDEGGFMGVNWGKALAMQTGILNLGMIGMGLSGLAEGVQDWANMTVTEWGIQKDKTTGLNTLVPIKKRKLSTSDLTLAQVNITSVLGALAVPLAKFGSELDAGGVSSLFGMNDVVAGIEQMGNIGNNLGSIADMVVKWASMEYVTSEIHTDKDGKKTLQPGKVMKIGKSAVNVATKNISSILTALTMPLVEFAKKLDDEDWDDAIEDSTESIKIMQDTLGGVAEWMEDIWSGTSMEKTNANYKSWIEGITSTDINKMFKGYKNFGKSLEFLDKDYLTKESDKNSVFNVFTKNIVLLAKNADKFGKFVDSFEKFGNGMGLFANNFKILDDDGIKAFNTWTNTLLSAVEVGKDQSGFTGFLDKADDVIDSAFSFGKSTFGSDSEEGSLSTSEKQSIIEKTNEQTKDDAIKQLTMAVSQLQSEIVGLKSSMSGTLNVNVQSVSSGAKIKTQPEA